MRSNRRVGGLHRYSGVRAAVVAVSVFGLGDAASAKNAVLVGNSSTCYVEIDGGTGRLQALLPTITSTSSIASTACDGSSAYMLLNRIGTQPQTVSIYNLTTGTLTGTISIPYNASEPAISDIAWLNGSLYGSWASTNGQTVKIRQINSNGSLTDVFTRSITSYPYASFPLLSADNTGNRMLLSTSKSSSTVDTPSLYVVSGADWSQQQYFAPASGNSAADLIMKLGGQSIVRSQPPFNSAFGPDQQVLSFPGLVVQSTLAAPFKYGNNGNGGSTSVSDEFNLTYDATMPGIAKINTSYNGSSDNKLFRARTAQNTLSVNVTNYAIPDGITLDSFQATSLSWSCASSGNLQYNTTLAPPGSLSARSVATTAVSLDPAGLPRGVYILNGLLQLQGLYQSGTESRTLSFQHSQPTSYAFAIDPVSDNLIGNGDMELGYFGWSSGAGVADTTPLHKSNSLSLMPSSSVPSKSTQILEMDTPNAPMLLEFDYRVSSVPNNTPGNLQMYLDGQLVADLKNLPVASEYQHYSVSITDPSVRMLSNAEFRILATTTGSSTWMYVDNISLTAVPEPHAILGFVAGALLCGRRRSRPAR